MTSSKQAYKLFCRFCAEETGDTKSGPLRPEDDKWKCPGCGALHYGLPPTQGRARACIQCGRIFDKDWTSPPLEDWELLPAYRVCKSCKKARDATKKGED